MHARCDARAQQGMQADGNGGDPFCEWLGSHFCLVWCGVLAANPSAILDASCSDAYAFIFGMSAALSATWVRWVQSSRVSPQSLSAMFWLCTAPHCHMEPEHKFTCHLWCCRCVSWGPHLWCECSCAVWGANYTFACALTLLPCDGRMWHSPHHCTVYRRDRGAFWALVHECAYRGQLQYAPRPDMYVTWSGLVHSTRGPPVVHAAERDRAMDSNRGALGA